MTAPATLFDYAGSVHAADPQTSRDAAAAGPRLSKQRLACLAALARAPLGLTPHEMVEQTPCAWPHVCSTRCLDLARLGLAERTDVTRPTGTGKQAGVWQVTDEGRAVLKQLTGERNP